MPPRSSRCPPTVAHDAKRTAEAASSGAVLPSVQGPAGRTIETVMSFVALEGEHFKAN